MIQTSSIIYMCISILVAIGLPIFLVVFFKKREGISLKFVFFGVITFIFFQMLTRIPILTYLQTQDFFINKIVSNKIVLALFLGITAALFEEIGRFIVFKLFLKRERSWKNGLAFGIGHGGIEAILLLGMTYINQVVLSIMFNTGGISNVAASTKLPIETITQMRDIIANTAPYMFLVGGLERVFAIGLQIALSIMVLYSVKTKKYRYLIFALIIHAAVDIAVTICAPISILIAEGFMLVVFVLSLVYINKSRCAYKNIDRIIPINNSKEGGIL